MKKFFSFAVFCALLFDASAAAPPILHNAATTNANPRAAVATNYIYAGSVSPRMFGAAANANAWTFTGTDDIAALYATIAAKPASNVNYVIDCEGLNYLINGQLQITNDFITLKNFVFISTNTTLCPIILSGDSCTIENFTLIGPGTNVSAGTQVGADVYGLMVTNKPWKSTADYIIHSTIRNGNIWGFSHNLVVHGMEHGVIENLICSNARSNNFLFSFTDGLRVVGGHYGSAAIANGSVVSAAGFFPTNTADAWMSNSTAICGRGPFQDITFINTSAGGGRYAFDVRDGSSITIDGLHTEDMRNLQTVAAVNVFSNVSGINVRNAYMVKVTGALPDAFGWLLLDCPGPSVTIDSFGPWGGAPFYASYFNPLALGGSTYLPGVASAHNRTMPRIMRGSVSGNIVYRELTSLAATNGRDTTILSHAGTVPNTDGLLTYWTGRHYYTNATDGTANVYTYYGGNTLDLYGGTGTEDMTVGSSFGTFNRTADNQVWGLYGSALSSANFALLTYQAVTSQAIERIGFDYGSGKAGATKVALGTANSYNTAGIERWAVDTTGSLLPTTKAYNLGSVAAPAGKLFATNALLGLIQTTNLTLLSTPTFPNTNHLVGTDGFLWNSNKVLYWVTTTKTNVVNDGR